MIKIKMGVREIRRLKNAKEAKKGGGGGGNKGGEKEWVRITTCMMTA